MRPAFTALFVLLVCSVAGQGRVQSRLAEKTAQLSAAIFVTKDSMQLESLFAPVLSYGHSRGRVENRSEALQGIIRNTSTYSDTLLSSITVQVQGKTAVVRHLFSARELKAGGMVVPLKLSIMLVWIKKKGEWKLFARQATALP